MATKLVCETCGAIFELDVALIVKQTGPKKRLDKGK